jgi:hypothetical protein
MAWVTTVENTIQPFAEPVVLIGGVAKTTLPSLHGSEPTPAIDLVPLHLVSISPCASGFQSAPVQDVLLFQIDLRALGVMLKGGRRKEFIVAASASCHRRNSIPEPLNNLEGALCHDFSPDLDTFASTVPDV